MAKLEQLIREYQAAIAARDYSEICRLCFEVEQQAERIDYTNHGRLLALHTQAEAA